ncbi:hypothetical protein [Acetobacter okinawensis]|uniref:hypothetical protein n=1 Tax=Acetobacter okinawensis TaxID=1076594 RepID=UPI0039E9B8E3
MHAVDSIRPRPMRSWALVKDGIIVAVCTILASEKHGFAEGAGRVVDVTGADAQLGYYVDTKGNVTPSEGRKSPIPEGRPAYLEGPPVPAPATGPLGVALTSAGITPSRDPDHPSNWPQNAGKQEVAADGEADNAQT